MAAGYEGEATQGESESGSAAEPTARSSPIVADGGNWMIAPKNTSYRGGENHFKRVLLRNVAT